MGRTNITSVGFAVSRTIAAYRVDRLWGSLQCKDSIHDVST